MHRLTRTASGTCFGGKEKVNRIRSPPADGSWVKPGGTKHRRHRASIIRLHRPSVKSLRYNHLPCKTPPRPARRRCLCLRHRLPQATTRRCPRRARLRVRRHGQGLASSPTSIVCLPRSSSKRGRHCLRQRRHLRAEAVRRSEAFDGLQRARRSQRPRRLHRRGRSAGGCRSQKVDAALAVVQPQAKPTHHPSCTPRLASEDGQTTAGSSQAPDSIRKTSRTSSPLEEARARRLQGHASPRR